MRPPAAAVGVDLRALVGTPTGIGWLTLELLERLARRRRYRYVGLSHKETAADRSLEGAGVTLERQAAPLGVWWQQLVVPPRLAAGDLDLFWSPLGVLPWILPIPAVVTVHDLTPLLMPRAHTRKVRWSVAPFLRRTVHTARRVVVDSRSTARDLEARYPACRRRLRVVYPGVDEAFRPASPQEVAAIRAELGCPDGYLLFAGTLEPRKNVALLLDVWQELSSEPGTPPLVLCGGPGWSSAGLAQRIESLRGRGVLHLGYQPRERLIRIFQGARLFVYPSLYEGFGLPVAEAMACGLPIVTSDRSSLPEVVGDAGVRVDPERPDALAAALRRLLAEPSLAEELGLQARRRSRRFDWEVTAQQMEEVFSEALG